MVAPVAVDSMEAVLAVEVSALPVVASEVIAPVSKERRATVEKMRHRRQTLRLTTYTLLIANRKVPNATRSVAHRLL